MIRYGAMAAAGAVVIALALFGAARLTAVSYELSGVADPREALAETASDILNDDREVVRHQPLPDAVRAVYMTACVAGTPSFRQELVELIDTTEVNSVVIDIKDYSGTISFPPVSDAWRPAWQAAKCGTSDMKEFIAELHDKEVFVIGRITVFQDPHYTKLHPDLAVKRADGVSVWKDHKGLSFIDVGATEYWDHIIELAKESYNIGFDELNFDYIRYPSDGPMEDIAFTHSKDFPGDDNKQANLESFFKYLHEKMSDPERFAAVRHEITGREDAVPWTSADLFGMTTTNYV